MIICHVAPVARAVRRVIVARPRVSVVGVAAASAVRRAARPIVSKPALVCRDLGMLALASSLGGAAPLAPVASVGPAGIGAVHAPAMAMLAGGGRGDLLPPSSGGTPVPGQLPPNLSAALLAPSGNAPLVPPDLLFDPARTTVVPPGPVQGSPEGVPNQSGRPSVAVPEPSSLAVFLAAVFGCLVLARRRA